MQISRTPLRVSFLGGGTDLPWYFEKFGGCVISMAINKHIYITGRPMFEEDTFLLRYSKLERTKDLTQIEHPIIKEVLRYFKVKSIDIGVSSDFPAGTGMGSSSAFTVGLIKLMTAFTGGDLTDFEIAELACKLEIEVLKEPIGKQDQFSSSFGGLNFFEFKPNGKVEIKKIEISTKSLDWLNSSLYLVPIGNSRSASKMLLYQAKKAQEDLRLIDGLHSLQQLTLESVEKIQTDVSYLSEVLNLSWELKKRSNPEVTNEGVDSLISIGLKNGADGAKLLGAGGSGFILFIVQENQFNRFEGSITSLGNKIIPVQLDSHGSVTLYNSAENYEL